MYDEVMSLSFREQEERGLGEARSGNYLPAANVGLFCAFILERVFKSRFYGQTAKVLSLQESVATG